MHPTIPNNIIVGVANSGLNIGFHSSTVSYDLGGILGHIRGSLDSIIHKASYLSNVEITSMLTTDAHGVQRYIPVPVITSSDITMNADDVALALAGDPLMTVITALVPLFKGVIVEMVQSIVMTSVKDTINA